MAGRCKQYADVYDPSTRRTRKVCVARYRSSGSAGVGGLAGFGQAGSLKATFGSIKDVLIMGTIAAGGAIVTEKVYNTVAGRLELAGYQRDLAKIATGVALGIIISKVLKKPRLGAAFAIGPIVAGAINIFQELMGPVEGLGLIAINPATPETSMYAPDMMPMALPSAATAPAPPPPPQINQGLGAVQVGPGVPDWMRFPGQKPETAYNVIGAVQ